MKQGGTAARHIAESEANTFLDRAKTVAPSVLVESFPTLQLAQRVALANALSQSCEHFFLQRLVLTILLKQPLYLPIFFKVGYTSMLSQLSAHLNLVFEPFVKKPITTFINLGPFVEPMKDVLHESLEHIKYGLAELQLTKVQSEKAVTSLKNE